MINKKHTIQKLPLLLLFCSLGFAPASGQDTVRVGSRMLEGAIPALGTISIESFKLQGGVRTPISRTIQTVEEAIEGDLPIYKISSVHWAVGRGDTALTTIIVRSRDFALLRHKVKASHDSALVVYSQGFLSGWVVLPNQPISLLDVTASQPVFPVDGPAPWFLSAFPLSEGFSVIIPRFSMWDKGEKFEELRVMGTEVLQRNGQNIECWKVDNGPFAIPGYRAFRWVDKKTRRILQTLLRGKPDEPEYWSIAQ